MEHPSTIGWHSFLLSLAPGEQTTQRGRSNEAQTYWGEMH